MEKKSLFYGEKKNTNLGQRSRTSLGESAILLEERSINFLKTRLL